ncbi:uncharacterized protein SPAPADRAFT_58831 [Spathaspora passalidarum NRRL Y-27907]|uniref:Uncharacterized protein n=1 Tax=Spathaspora passalidarum (strain NRRL Y-27907 / 11-Y1) TaxID=619300 RepID=G3AE79_SPAPN|nr:uncharacterized protein SPAPADRAFT_58831 [Spathaspora passalidarum NRRL Y-27907]EGW35613.1 hypothetical protein SPAPADRAFT_58831 [Spathaspora passalidarum NRRL Y-27907]
MMNVKVFSTTADIESERDLIELIKGINSLESISNYNIIEIKDDDGKVYWSIYAESGKLNYISLVSSATRLLQAKESGCKVYRSKVCCSFDIDYFNPYELYKKC